MNRRDRVTFNLLDEPWLPVRDENGRALQVGLRAALLESNRWLELRDPSPLVTASLIRLLLAVLHRSIEQVSDDEAWLEHWKRGTWDIDSVRRYLDQQQDHFDLYHPTRPFFQIPDLGIPQPQWVAVTNLGLEFASGNNDTLFDHSHDALPVAWPADMVARYLVTLQSFALGGGKSSSSKRFGSHPYRSHGPCVGRVLAFARGKNLFQTLALNIVFTPNERLAAGQAPGQDQPFWEVDPARLTAPGTRAIAGVLDYLTWSSRAALLHPDSEGRVTHIELTSLHALPPRELGWRDPWALHGATDQAPGHVPLALRVDRALWRDSHALVPAEPGLMPEHLVRLRRIGPDEIDMTCVRVDAIGLASDQAKPLTWRQDEFVVPGVVIQDPGRSLIFERGLKEVDRISRLLEGSLRRLADRLLALNGVQSPRAEEVRRFVNRLGAMPRFWGQMDAPFTVFLERLGSDDPEGAMSAFAATAQEVAHQVFESTSDGCLGRGRRELRARAELAGHLKYQLNANQHGPAGSTA